MSQVEGTTDTTSRALDYLTRDDDRARDVRTLASLVSPTAVIEPELIRQMRLRVEPSLATSVEADLWFSPLVQDRGPSGITLAWEVVPTLVDLLRDRVRAAAAGDPVLDVGRILAEVHDHAPPLRVVQEKVTWASITGDLESVDDELAKVLHAQREPSRQLGVSGWVDRVLRHLPDPVRATSTAWQLGVEASIATGRDVGLDVEAPLGLFDAELADVSEAGTALLPIRRTDGTVELGAVDGEVAFGINVPATSPIVVRLEWPDVGRARSATIREGRLTTVPDHDGPLRIRTLAGYVHEIGADAVPHGAEVLTGSTFTLDVLPAREGTSVWIEYGDAAAPRRILVDGGPGSTAAELVRRLQELDPDDRRFELIISSHLDEPNSGGLVRLLENAVQAQQDALPDLFTVDDVWANALAFEQEETMGAGPSMSPLAEQLARLGLPVNRAFDGRTVMRGSASLPRVELPGGMSVTVLGPSEKALEELGARWESEGVL